MIAIPNMDMPEHCYECLLRQGNCCLLLYEATPPTVPLTRLDDCPLIDIVQCKDCKWFELDVWGEFNGIPLIVAHEMCKFWGNGCKTNPNGFCSYGERRSE